jgi:hypothetical protein
MKVAKGCTKIVGKHFKLGKSRHIELHSNAVEQRIA